MLLWARQFLFVVRSGGNHGLRGVEEQRPTVPQPRCRGESRSMSPIEKSPVHVNIFMYIARTDRYTSADSHAVWQARSQLKGLLYDSTTGTYQSTFRSVRLWNAKEEGAF